MYYVLQLVTSDKETAPADNYERQRCILLCKGLFVSTHLAQCNFRGHARPSADVLNVTMQNLATDDFGTVKTIDRSIVFFKKLPADLSDEVLATYEVPWKKYLFVLNEWADKSIITKELFNNFLARSPHKDRLKEEHDITPEEN